MMIKASAGGGGKGMRYRAQRGRGGGRKVLRALVRGRNLSFGDDRVFIEKFIVDTCNVQI